MILQAGNDCYLTQAADVPLVERVFENQVLIYSAEQVNEWKEIPSSEKDKMFAQKNFVDVENLDYDALKRVEQLNEDIKENINNAELSDEQALDMQGLFPEWSVLVASVTGVSAPVGFRLQHKGTLYKVIQEHTLQSNWEPGVGTESLYQVVQVAHAGTREDPIPWQHNMVLENGKFYTDKGVLYECIRDSGIGMVYDLKDLVSGGYVKEV